MKVAIRSNRFTFCTLWLGLTAILHLCPIESGWTQDNTGGPVEATTQPENFLDLRGDVPNPRRIDAAEFRRLPRVEARTADPHDPGKVMVYSGTPLVEVLKAGGLRLDPGMAGIRETVTISVVVEATDGYKAVFALAELDPDLTDRVIILADVKDGQPLPARESPFRIIVPGEKRPARWVRQVRALIVRKN